MRYLWRSFFSLALLVLLAIASCAAPRTSSLGQKPSDLPRVAPSQPANDDEAIRRLIADEGAGLVRQDTGALMDLWADDAVITDAKQTPDNLSDDLTRQGKDAIRSRYVVLVFPGRPQPTDANDVQVQFAGDRPTVGRTTATGSGLNQGSDRWTFVMRGGRWRIESLTYNLEK
jgi:hypothetical protein